MAAPKTNIWLHELNPAPPDARPTRYLTTHQYESVESYSNPPSERHGEQADAKPAASESSYHPLNRGASPPATTTHIHEEPRVSKWYFAITVFNILAPLLICALFLIIIVRYLLRSATNGVVPNHRVDPRTMFFIWLILGIFLLEWGKTAMASIEGAVLLNHPRFAPRSSAQLLWHLDRGWASLATWWALICHTYHYLFPDKRYAHRRQWRGPGRLWWFLALNYFLFALTVPLAGLAMDPDEASKIGDDPVIIFGVNETTFDVRTNTAVSGLARNNWRTGRATSPGEPAIFYAPIGTQNASATYFEDAAQRIYEHDLANPENPTDVRRINFFSGPTVAQRAHGTAWGVETTVECSAVNLDALTLIDAVSPTNWTSPVSYDTAEFWDENAAGLSPFFAYSYDNVFGNNVTYLVASDRDINAPGTGDYIVYNNSVTLGDAIVGSFEMAIWQAVATGFPPDESFQNLSSHPLVTTPDNGTYYGYGVRCNVTSDVGYAQLDAVQRTFTDFTHHLATWGANSVGSVAGASVPIFQYPGVFAIQSLVFQSLSTLSLGYFGPPSCRNSTTDAGCNAFYGANAATGGIPRIATVGDGGYGRALQVPSISPERMTLALYKLFGETAAAMMDIGNGNWTKSDFVALEPANDLVQGRVSWVLVLVLLSVWTVLAVVPQLFLLKEARWGESIEVFAIKRYGVHWKENVAR